ncbi:MAG: hypothetical protein U0230_24305 [Polyangiales bacterium]
MRLRSACQATLAVLLASAGAGPLASRAEDTREAPPASAELVRARLAMLEGTTDPALVHARAALEACVATTGEACAREGACAIAVAAVELAEARSRLARARASVARFGARTPTGGAPPTTQVHDDGEPAPEASSASLCPGDCETLARLHELSALVERQAIALEAGLAPGDVRAVGEPSSVLAARLAEATANETFEEATVDENRRYARVEREREATRRTARNAILASIPGRIADLRRLGVDESVLSAFSERATAARREADPARSLLALEDLADDLGALERRVHEGAPR